MRAGNSSMNTFSRTCPSPPTGRVIAEEIELQPRALSKVFEDYLPQESEIDFFTIDVEVWSCRPVSNDWGEVPAEVIMLEDFAP